MEGTHAMTLRLEPGLASALAQVAQVDQVSVSDAVRTAVSEHIDRRRKDKAFQKRLQMHIDMNREILERLAN